MNKLIGFLTLFSVIFICSCKSESFDTNPQTQLQQAIFSGSISDIDKAVQAGASLNKPIGCGDFLPIEGAIVINDISKFKYLFKHGAAINKRCIAAANKSQNKAFIQLLESQ